MRTLVEQHEFNLRRWAELIADPEIAAVLNKIETDRDGNVIMIPPATGAHGDRQTDIASRLKGLLPKGRVITECGVSTSQGGKVPDVAWLSMEHPQVLDDEMKLARPAPEICIEVLSPENSATDIAQKTALYFEAGAREVWICGLNGGMRFLTKGATVEGRSRIFPEFPRMIYTFGEQLEQQRKKDVRERVAERDSGQDLGLEL